MSWSCYQFYDYVKTHSRLNIAKTTEVQKMEKKMCASHCYCLRKHLIEEDASFNFYLYRCPHLQEGTSK